MRRILLLNRNHIGDALFTTPAIAALRAALPDALIVNAISRGTEALFERNPHISENWRRTPTWKDDSAFLRNVRRTHFDAVINFATSSTLLALYAWLSGAKRRVGFDHPSMARFYTDRIPLRGPEAHHVNDSLDLARALVPVTQEFRMEYFLDPAWDAEWRAILPELEDNSAPWVGLNPGATVPPNRWPVERWAALAGLLAKSGLRPVLFGGPADAELAEQVLSLSSMPIPSLQGKLSLRGLGAAIRRCAVFVSGDTGPMHVAVSVDTPVVALFGPANPARTGPYTDRAVVVYNPEPGPDGHPMGGITMDEAESAVRKALERFSGNGERKNL